MQRPGIFIERKDLIASIDLMGESNVALASMDGWIRFEMDDARPKNLQERKVVRPMGILAFHF